MCSVFPKTFKTKIQSGEVYAKRQKNGVLLELVDARNRQWG